jgi:thioredoxin 1
MNSEPAPDPTAAVGEANFQAVVLAADRPVIVAFHAPWSRPCHILEAALDEVAAECAGSVKVVRVNADDHPELSLWYDIQSVPTLLFFVAGKPAARLVGTASKQAILAKLQSVAQPEPDRL